MPTLTIKDDENDGATLVSLHLGPIADPSKATIAILTALASLPPPKRKRNRAKKTPTT